MGPNRAPTGRPRTGRGAVDISQKIVWNVYSTGVTLVGGLVSKQLVDGAWSFVTGEAPPDPNDPETPAAAALARVLAIAVGMGLTQVFLNRFAARRWAAMTGEPSPARMVSLRL